MYTMSMIMRQKYSEMLYRFLVFLFIGPVILVSPSKNQENGCGQVSVDDCLTKVQAFLSLTSLPFISDRTELDNLCSNAKEVHKCSSKLLSTSGCLVGRDIDFFDNFANIAENNTWLADICLNVGKTRTKRQFYPENGNFSVNSECSEKLMKPAVCCVEKITAAFRESSTGLSLQTSEDACCMAANMFKCIHSAARVNCGDDMATEVLQPVRLNLERRSSACLTVDIFNPDPKVCTALAPVCASSRIGTFIEFIVLICLLFIMWISYL